MTSALYIDPNGPYPALGLDCWDATRNAEDYAGPGPVIAHPPCGPWGQLRQFCTKQDPAIGPIAVQQVRRWGGVLEHPAWSTLWRHCSLPTPSEEGDLPGVAGNEWSVCVDQSRWGHPAQKRTWLFFVGVRPADLPPLPPRRAAVAVIRPRANGMGAVHVPKSQRHLTPPAFASWLLASMSSLAERVR